MSSFVGNRSSSMKKVVAFPWTAYWELTKPRISSMVLVTVAVAAVVSAPWTIRISTVAHVLLGMFLVAASGNAMNMYLERYSDFLMRRTAKRPLPDRRLSSTNVLNFSAITLGAGLAYLLLLTNWQTACCAAATWLLYSFVYTPLKAVSPLNTEVGAIAGALPVAAGALAASGTLDPFGWGLFSMLLFWQFPHFMAIAWLYRHQYHDGGLKMLTVTDPTGQAAGRKAITMSLLTWLASLIPALGIDHGGVKGGFICLATVMAIYYFRTSLRFARCRDDATARQLLRVSIIYLPLYLGTLLISCRW